ncbi:hypothetical protein E2562_030429 [Oryza meyeriana var. granulata]|uniref:Uncharacterized protein n=1 Tax=Oryza meyeriana var. granulata TaxID=110450 RepID=A0A6G1FDX6_9ORYZ|nr:hypothetical protein E2562_030429 [Oryza meyeriana var. granulata]
MATSGNGAPGSQPPHPHAPAPAAGGRLYRCPVCPGPVIWRSCHDLRNHLYTIHPNEAAELAMPFTRYVETSRRERRVAAFLQGPAPPVPVAPPQRAPARSPTVRDTFVPLPPNSAFWGEYLRGGSRPVEIDFFGPAPPPAVAPAPTPEPVVPPVMCGLHVSDSESSELDNLV